jgi:hypothetical protein
VCIDEAFTRATGYTLEEIARKTLRIFPDPQWSAQKSVVVELSNFVVFCSGRFLPHDLVILLDDLQNTHPEASIFSKP